jgi:hypothetical protein
MTGHSYQAKQELAAPGQPKIPRAPDQAGRVSRVNSAEFADSQCFSRPYVTKLVQQGVIVRDAKGQIDKDAAIAAIQARREPLRAIRRGRLRKNIEISGGGQETLSTMLLKSRIKTEAAFMSARRVRDGLMNIPARVASLYAAETDSQKIHQNLEDEIGNVLTDLIRETETTSTG